MQENTNDYKSPNYEENFRERLRTLRNEKQISARELSLALGQNVNYINLIENGKRLPSMQGFFSLCEYFEISPAQFFPSPTQTKSTPTQKEILSIFSRLSKPQAATIIEMLNQFL